MLAPCHFQSLECHDPVQESSLQRHCRLCLNISEIRHVLKLTLCVGIVMPNLFVLNVLFGFYYIFTSKTCSDQHVANKREVTTSAGYALLSLVVYIILFICYYRLAIYNPGNVI